MKPALNALLAALLCGAGGHAGEGAVIQAGNRIPPFAEDAGHVPKVLAYYERYRARLSGRGMPKS